MAEAEAKINTLTESQFLHFQTSSRTSTKYIVPMTTKRVQTKHRAYSDQNVTYKVTHDITSKTGDPSSITIRRPLQSSIQKEAQGDIPRLDDDSLTDVTKRQNVITELLIKQSALSQLPQREISVFHGDPLQFRCFIRSFEQTIKN